MTQTELARRLGVSRLSVSELLHEKRRVVAGHGDAARQAPRTSPESWLRMQTAVDLWELAQRGGTRRSKRSRWP